MPNRQPSRAPLPAIPAIDYRLVAKTPYAELGSYLASYLASVPLNLRSNARSKLTRLMVIQFYELSTDVCDELVRRRVEDIEVPFLPNREEFHPKRNQACGKLATLDLSSDIYFELGRRYPEFKDLPRNCDENFSAALASRHKPSQSFYSEIRGP
ncbi:hypothetical protein BDZ97DRAFT_1790124 [Flammula alnicola]|nr:hypothetical protein BDZ97DRAFT_1790124 [Flammula alnicola]